MAVSPAAAPLPSDQTPAEARPGVRDRILPAEWRERVNLAACYRLVAREGWDDLIYAHISARIPGEDTFLINPFGLFFHEVTASNLVKVDFNGAIVFESEYEYNPGAYLVHRAIHAAHPEIGCILHLHTPAGIAVSTQSDGLLPVTQNALMFHGAIAYHDYEGLTVTTDEITRVAAKLSGKSILMLRGHGTLVAGRDTAQAFVFAHLLERACRMQVAAQSAGGNLVEPPEDVQNKVQEQVRDIFPGLGSMEWPGLLRLLDREMPGYAD